jgi:hypothetical protein
VKAEPDAILTSRQRHANLWVTSVIFWKPTGLITLGICPSRYVVNCSAEFNRFTLMNLHSALAENLLPFADVNKRTSRLAANLPLFRANLCPLTFLDVPEQAYSRAILGVYEMTRIELLRDLYVWAYERSTQEYQAIKQDLAEPDPLRLAWRDFIKQTIRQVIKQPDIDPLSNIQRSVAEHIPEHEQSDVQALLVEELRRLHEGVLARYGVRPSEYAAWKSQNRH